MSGDDPKLGHIVRYAYNWKSDAITGQEAGKKDRPCVITNIRRREDGSKSVVVSPITHTKQEGHQASVPVPIKTARRIGLDDRPSYIVTNECNRFDWPGPDVRPADPKQPDKGFLVGKCPEKLLGAVRQKLLSNQRAKDLKVVDRSSELKARVQNIRARQYQAGTDKEKDHSKG